MKPKRTMVVDLQATGLCLRGILNCSPISSVARRNVAERLTGSFRRSLIALAWFRPWRPVPLDTARHSCLSESQSDLGAYLSGTLLAA